MSRFMQHYEPVEEGWGMALYNVASWVLPTKVNAPKAILSNMMLKKILDNKELRKYIIAQCDEILKNEQAHDKSVTTKLPSNPIALLKTWFKKKSVIKTISKTNLMHDSNNLLEDKLFDLKLGKYTTTFWYDTSHIDAAIVVLYSKDKDQIFGKRIPAPKSGELKKSFHKEKGLL